ASSTVWATAHGGTGRPWATSSNLASASWSFTRRQAPDREVGEGGASMVAEPSSPRRTKMERSATVASPYSASAARSVASPPRGVMQRDLVERARTGDHDA